MTNDIRCVVTDLDGTLLHSDKEISAYTLDTLAKCRRIGIKIVVATARSEQGAKRFLRQVNPDAIISCGGAFVTQNGRELWSRLMDATLVDRLMKALLSDPSVGTVTLETREGYFSNSYDTARAPDYSHCRYNDFSVLPHQPAFKITSEIFTYEGKARFRNRFPECSIIGYTGEDWCRFAMPEAVKASALMNLCGLWDVPLKYVAAFGDDENDADMLSACGYGVAMGNAIEPVKLAARNVTQTNDEDGVARFLEQHVLKGELIP